MTHQATIKKFQDFAAENPRFVLLHRTRLDVDEHTTVLGCTLWTHVPDDHAHEVASRLTDFHEIRGIRDWDFATHIAEHELDAEWLDTQVTTIEREEPHRRIIILTHHSPTRDARTNDPRFPDTGKPLSSGFRTDLSMRPCWTSPKVRLWAFGHTHYSCAFEDEATGKLVVANQKGYEKLKPTTISTANMTASRSSISHVVVEATPGDGKWKLLMEEKKEREQSAKCQEGLLKKDTSTSTKAKEIGKVPLGPKSSNMFSRLSNKLQRAVCK